MCPARTHLPSPRTISNTLNADKNVPSTLNTHMVAQFGQFLDHDFALTPEFHLEHCCPEEDGPGSNEGLFFLTQLSLWSCILVIGMKRAVRNQNLTLL